MGIIYCRNPNQKQIDQHKIEKKIAKIRLKQREKNRKRREGPDVKEEKRLEPKLQPANKGMCQKKDFFNVSGVYFLYKNNFIVYVGESACIFSRIKEHVGVKDFDSFTYTLEPNTELRKAKEIEMIRKFRPTYNIVHNTTHKDKGVTYSRAY